MLKINNSRKSKMTKKQYFMLLGAMVAGLTFTAPVTSVKALAETNEEVIEETEAAVEENETDEASEE